MRSSFELRGTDKGVNEHVCNYRNTWWSSARWSAGYLMEKGNILVLLQPAELVIIAGAAMGTVLISNRPHILKENPARESAESSRESEFSTRRYLDSLKMLYELFSRARRDGLSAVEGDIEQPEESKVFSAYPAVIKDQGGPRIHLRHAAHRSQLGGGPVRSGSDDGTGYGSSPP